jgi:predicted HTH domain antitoxin
MATMTIRVEVPEELSELGDSHEELAMRAQRSLVLDLLRDGMIGQARAARLLGITRWDILDLMARYRIPSGPLTAEEVDRDLANARPGAVLGRADAGR